MRRLLWLYEVLLRLYPARFRAEFGDEMRATFAQVIQEQTGSSRVFHILIELRDFPISVLREHIAERRRKELSMEQAQISHNPFTYRFCLTIITILLLSIVVFTILPFYAFGLHNQPTNEITGGHFDPKGMAFYQTPLGTLVYLLGIIMFIATPIFLTAFVPIMLMSMARNWNMLTWRWQAYGAGLLVVCAAIVLFLYAGTGRLILIWFMD